MRRIHRSIVLANLINKNEYKKIAEIGVYQGGTAKFILENCNIDSYWAIDQWQVLDKKHQSSFQFRHTETEWHDFFIMNCKLMVSHSKLHLVRTSSKEAAAIFENEFFDLVFIDASHYYEDVIQDIALWSPLVREGGIISGHDYGLGHKKNFKVKEAVDTFYKNVNVAADYVWWVKKESIPTNKPNAIFI